MSALGQEVEGSTLVLGLEAADNPALDLAVLVVEAWLAVVQLLQPEAADKLAVAVVRSLSIDREVCDGAVLLVNRREAAGSSRKQRSSLGKGSRSTAQNGSRCSRRLLSLTQHD